MGNVRLMAPAPEVASAAGARPAAGGGGVAQGGEPGVDPHPRVFEQLEGPAEEVAATALFLASDESSYFTGQVLSPNGGIYMT